MMRTWLRGWAAWTLAATFGSSAAAAVEKPQSRSVPMPSVDAAATRPRISSQVLNSSSACSSSTRAAGVSRMRRPSCTTRSVPSSFPSERSCWETAEGA